MGCRTVHIIFVQALLTMLPKLLMLVLGRKDVQVWQRHSKSHDALGKLILVG